MAWQVHLDVSFQLFLFPSIHPVTVEVKGLSIREIRQVMLFGLGASSHMYDSQSKPPLINQMFL